MALGGCLAATSGGCSAACGGVEQRCWSAALCAAASVGIGGILLSVSLALVLAVATSLRCCTKGCSIINGGCVGGFVKWDCGTSPRL